MWREEYKGALHDVIHYSALGYQRGLVTAAGGNVSIRCAEGILITRTGVSLREVTEADLLLVNLSGDILYNPGNGKPSKETGFHLGIYQARRSVNCVYHVHPPYVTAFSISVGEFPRVTSGAKNKLCAAPLIEPLRSGSRELLEKIEHTVRESNERTQALILGAHGIVTFASTMEDCFQIAELMEDSARIAYFDLQIRSAGILETGGHRG